MPLYLISFQKGDWTVPEGGLAEVGRASHAVIQQAKDAGVYVFSGGLKYDDGSVEHAEVSVDGVVTDGPYPESKELIGGVTIVNVADRETALQWAARIAAACRCPQHVRTFIPDRESL
jgi:hypothetical protein